MRGWISRRWFLKAHAAGPVLLGAIVGASGEARGDDPPAPAPKATAKRKKDMPPKLDADLVRQFVIAGHGDLDKVKALLAAEPKLINACWDWGGGDWETALGGAAHVGRPEIAGFLLEHGARLDVFAAAMLGKLDVVKAAVAAFPAIVDVPGPHGIPLIDHARAGKDAAVAVLDYLKGLKPA